MQINQRRDLNRGQATKQIELEDQIVGDILKLYYSFFVKPKKKPFAHTPNEACWLQI